MPMNTRDRRSRHTFWIDDRVIDEFATGDAASTRSWHSGLGGLRASGPPRRS